MTDLRAAAQQALEAIDWLRLHLQRDHQCLHMDPAQSGIPAWINKSETNLRAALAEPVQEPVAVVGTQGDVWRGYAGQWAPPGPPIKTVLMLRDLPEGTLLYTAPPQRKPLSQDETMRLVNETAGSHWCDEAHLQRIRAAIERAHGIGGNDESA